MLDKFFKENWNDDKGNPAGGTCSGKGAVISWQKGPLGRDNERKESNGAFVETIIAMAKSRLEFYESSKFSCSENSDAIIHLEKALEILDSRTKSRESRKVEGTHNI